MAADNATEVAKEVNHMIEHHVVNAWVWQSESLQLGPFDFSISKHVLVMFVAAALLILMGIWVRRKISLVPKGFGSMIEVFVLFIRDEIATPTMGAHAALKYTGYLCTTFFFILTCNLLGLIPYSTTATSNISVTAGLATISFLIIQFAGMRKMGVFGYFGHLVPHGVPFWLAPVMVVVELMGLFAKPFALCVRLFANMLAGHVVILSLLGLIFIMGVVMIPVSLAFGVFMYLLELFVAFLQAYIFTMLTSLFIGLLVAGEH